MLSSEQCEEFFRAVYSTVYPIVVKPTTRASFLYGGNPWKSEKFGQYHDDERLEIPSPRNVAEAEANAVIERQSFEMQTTSHARQIAQINSRSRSDRSQLHRLYRLAVNEAFACGISDGMVAGRVQRQRLLDELRAKCAVARAD